MNKVLWVIYMFVYCSVSFVCVCVCVCVCVSVHPCASMCMCVGVDVQACARVCIYMYKAHVCTFTRAHAPVCACLSVKLAFSITYYLNQHTTSANINLNTSSTTGLHKKKINIPKSPHPNVFGIITNPQGLEVHRIFFLLLILRTLLINMLKKNQ
jgi:hypothetical protein